MKVREDDSPENNKSEMQTEPNELLDTFQSDDLKDLKESNSKYKSKK